MTMFRSPSSHREMFLRPDEFMDKAPAKIGEQVHVNHAGCTAGTDTKRRLYVKRNEDGSVVAYCHHCGKRGVSQHGARTFGYRSYGSGGSVLHAHGSSGTGVAAPTETTGSELGADKARRFAIPSDTTTETRDWPNEAFDWVSQFELIPEYLAKRCGWAYSPLRRRLVIPVYDRIDGGLFGYQTRRLFDDDAHKEKYLTYKNKDKCVGRLYYKCTARSSGGIVLVEDALSAEKLFSVVDAVALLTTSGSICDLRNVVARYEHTFIWLDDDNLDVQRKQLQLKKQLDPYVSVSIIRTGKDPKRHSVEELHENTRV